MKLLLSLCWWLVKSVATFATRNMGKTKSGLYATGIAYLMASGPMLLPLFTQPKIYVETPGGKSGNWRFCLNDNVQLNLWAFLGIPQRSDIVARNHQIEFCDEDNRTWATLDYFGNLNIKAGYAWNGCSPKWWAFGRWWGTPDPTCTHLASLVHDVLYQFGNTNHFPFNRDACDMVFYNLIVACAGNIHLAGTYYGAVCKLGNRFFQKNSCYSFVSVARVDHAPADNGGA